ncbi:hypothetical protein OROGR_026546 [Orobanche gracilis]
MDTDLERWSHVEKKRQKKKTDKNVWAHDDSLDHKRKSAAYATYHFHRGNK